MALQGTIDSFPLADVLRFLAGGGRSGVLQVDGDRGTVRIWMEDGECTAAESAGVVVDDAVQATYEALRCTAGSFSFDEDRRAPVSTAVPRPVSVVLAEALALRAEWEAVEQVLPSPRHRVRPVLAPPDGRVVLDQLGWRIATTLGRSDDVASVVARSGADELDAARSIVAMVRDGLLEVEGPSPSVAEPAEIVLDPFVAAAAPSAPTATPATSEGAVLDVATPVAEVEEPLPAAPLRPVEPSVTATAPMSGTAAGAADPFHAVDDVFPIDDLVAVDDSSDPWAAVSAPASDETSHLSADVADAIAEVLGTEGSARGGRTYEGGDPAFR